MNGYVPKVGDKVKATLGESVVTGVVAEITMRDGYPTVVDVFAGPHTFDNVGLIAHGKEGWQFEQVVSVPTKFGAVIRRADGEKFVLSSPYSFDCWYGGKELGWTRGEHATEGGFTVLFEGVDE